ncbi:MAG: DUF4126 domain-containing protein [Leeuwenhoekiella sp.]
MESLQLEWIIGAFLGIGLATAAGFRVFLPLLALSLGMFFDYIPVKEGWEWLGSTAAVILLGTATIAEIGAYYIPWFDNVLDSIAVPLAGICGTAVMFATLGDLPPWITWSLALIAGGGTASIIAGTTAAIRGVSTASTAGLGNPVVSTVETGVSGAMSFLALFLPLIAFLGFLVILYLLFKGWKKIRLRGKNKSI